MVECICIDSSKKPKEIPESKWIKEGEKYNIIYTVTVLPQKEIGVHLAEIELDENCMPYEYFLLRRFAFTQEDLLLLMQLIKDCSDTDFSLEELMEQSQLIENQ